MLFFLVDDFFSAKKDKKKFMKDVYRVLKYHAEEQDDLLLNEVTLYLSKENQKPTIFDHILFADKYIYVITDFAYQGGIYGNVEDGYLFIQGYDKKKVKVRNPIIESEENVKKLEEFLSIRHSDKILVSVVVYSQNLMVPSQIAKKNQTSWFLSLHELEKTLEIAEQDDVEAISHDKTDKIVKAIYERSNMIKKEIKAQKIKK